jgi:hypothetical protein
VPAVIAGRDDVVAAETVVKRVQRGRVRITPSMACAGDAPISVGRPLDAELFAPSSLDGFRDRVKPRLVLKRPPLKPAVAEPTFPCRAGSAETLIWKRCSEGLTYDQTSRQ